MPNTVIGPRDCDNPAMIEGLLALPVLGPVLFWAGYHYHKDRNLPEPPLNLALCFALGIATAWLSRALYASLEPFGWRFDAVMLFLLILSMLSHSPQLPPFANPFPLVQSTPP